MTVDPQFQPHPSPTPASDGRDSSEESREEPPERAVGWRAAAVLTLLWALLLTAVVDPGFSHASAQDTTSSSGERATLQEDSSQEESRAGNTQRESVERAIERGLNFLASQQGGDGRLSQRYSVATTALGGLALLGAGVQYNRGPHGRVIYDVVRYLTEGAPQDPPGFIRDSEESPSRMHGHAYAILFLAQALGGVDQATKREQVRRVVGEGVRQILKSQTSRGGWGYLPGDQRDEASITVCCLQALRASKDAGIQVPKNNIDRAVRYLKDCCKDDGSFMYSLEGRYGSRSSFALTAAAISTLDAAGEYTEEIHSRGMSFMLKELRKHKRRPLDATENYPFYANLYAAQALHQIGGESWANWFGPATRQLLSWQKSDGFWESRFGNEYATAVALLILEVPRGYLPMFER